MVTIFRSRLRDDAGEEYRRLADHLLATAEAMPGFVSIKDFTAADGERLALVTFSSREAQAAWRDHPEHRRAQELGRRRFYSEYSIQICRVMEERSFG